MHDFNLKRTALFACLDEASKEIKGTTLDQTNVEQYTEREFRGTGRQDCNDYPSYLVNRGRNSSVERRPNFSVLRGRESIYKKPELPLIKCLKPRRTPDYQLNPHKWQKYSLADVDISDQTNKSAAFAFLKQIEDQRDAEVETAVTDPEFKRIEFKKSSHFKRNLQICKDNDELDDIDKPKLKGSKLMMPEYVVGQKADRKRKQNRIQNSERAAGTLKLSHLIDDDDEEEDDKHN